MSLVDMARGRAGSETETETKRVRDSKLFEGKLQLVSSGGSVHVYYLLSVASQE